jgi:chromosome segregation ATPase
MLTTKTLFAADGLDDRSLEFLANAIEKHNLPGFDYYEFKRAVGSLLQMQLDEATAYKSAFTTAATVGLTKDKLIETAGYYTNVIEKEKEQFDTALQAQNEVKINAREAENKRLRDQVERHKAEIVRLQDEIAQYLQQIEQGETSLQQEREKLEKAKSSFERTQKSIVMQIGKDIELMHKYL